MPTYEWYNNLIKPAWAPPAWLFGPVWTVLYAVIAVSFSYVLILFIQRKISFLVFLPFILNLVFNFAFTPLQFSLRNLPLATVDIYLVLGSLVWALVAIFPYSKLVTLVNIPYLLWVVFATILQTTITFLNR